MPLNIKPRQMSVKDPQTGQYKDFDLLSSNVVSVNDKTGAVSLDAGDIPVNNSGSDPESIRDALSTVNRALNDVEDKKADVIIASASGATASFTDGADDMPLKDCVVKIEPVQDLHGYDNPWPARGGKNLVPSTLDNLIARNGAGSWNNNIYTLNGLTFTVNDDGSIKINGTASTTTYFTFIPNNLGVPMDAGDYICHETGQSGITMTVVKNGSYWISASLSNTTGSLTESANISFYMAISNDTVVNNLTVYPMFEKGTSESDYSPYTNICPITGRTGCNVVVSPTLDAEDGTTYPISWQTEAGTVYGGYVDPIKGELVVDKAYAELTKDSAWSWNAGNSLAICSVPNAVVVNASNQNIVFANNNLFTPSAWVGRSTPEYSCGIFFGASYVFVRSANHIASVDDLKTILGDNTLQVVYQLATPQTYHLTPTEIRTLLGQNNIWADTGDVAVEYPADTKAYVDDAVPVTDVQVNGTSILQNGIANVPFASSSVPGVGKTSAAYGIDISVGTLIISKAAKESIKNGNNLYNPIVPNNQHESAFYGLAKAAGDTTQSESSNAVGTYTESAKSAISQMLDAPETVSGTTPSITAKAGVRYVCGEVATLTVTPCASGDCEIMFTSGTTPTVLTVPNTVVWVGSFDPTSLAANTVYDMIITDGVYGMVASWAV